MDKAPDTTEQESLSQSLTTPSVATSWPLDLEADDLSEPSLITRYGERFLDIVRLGESIMNVVSLGMLIIDDVYPESTPPKLGILGGAGTYATVGARMFYPGKKAKNVGFVVHTGSDFTRSTRDEIDSWKSGIHFIDTPKRETTRGKNVYSDGIRGFEFLTDRIQVDHTTLPNHYVIANVFHLICSPGRCVGMVKGILARRKELISSFPGLSDRISAKPIFVWEPMEGFCEPRNRGFVYEAMKHVDVFSPNVHELSLLFQDQQENEPGLERPLTVQDILQDPNKALKRATLAYPDGLAFQLQAKGFYDQDKALVIRNGEDGCIVFTRDRVTPIPAYHIPFEKLRGKEKRKWKSKVVDVTGGGNAFLGGFCAGLELGSSLCSRGYNLFEAAALYGTVAASFAIEQDGMPKLTQRKWDGAELWNREPAEDRLRTMIRRIDPSSLVPICSQEHREGLSQQFKSLDPSNADSFEIELNLDDLRRQFPQHQA